ncbi:MCE family protein [Nocardioides speluncae]|uniref:MCE family protein n=1 Tax=Nocardioides speluncae TaxID=2670337 RepID=UPI0012B16CDA|nr:MCE family protein [Nocardioides speluncae]
MKYSLKDRYRIGLLGIGALAMLIGVVGALSFLSVGAKTYTAELRHVAGLRSGEEVQVAGVGVGEVKGIKLEGRKVKVTFTVDDDIKLGKETRVEVKVATLLGTHYLQVFPDGGGELAGNNVPLDQTKVPFDLQAVLDEGTPLVQEFDIKLIERSLAQIASTFEATGGELGPALSGVQKLSQVMATRSDDLGELLRAARTVTRQLTSSGGDILTLMKQADLVFDTLRARRVTIRSLLKDLNLLSTQVNGLMDDIKGDVGPLLKDLDNTLTTLKKHDRSLQKTITSFKLAARYFANSTGSGPWASLYAPGLLPDNLTCITTGACQ